MDVRPPAMAGLFYPRDPRILSRDLQGYLDQARDFGQRPKAIIVPHAGYIYSGPIAASAYRQLMPLRGRISRVILLGPVHRVWVRGLALPGVDAFDTPLGRIPLDRAAMAEIASLPQVETLAAAHAQEHSLEVQLPFLQKVLGEFTLVPLAVGGATAQEVAQVLERLWGGEETLIVVSSDLSHYLPYQAGSQVDQATARAILNLHTDLVGEQACGAHPINGLLLAARQHGLQVHLLDLRNSGDTAGDRDRVVGYGAFTLTPAQAPRSADKGELLTRLARNAIAGKLGQAVERPALPAWLQEPGASFVTLTRNGELRGCMGTLEAHRSLVEDLEHNARAAAFHDPRFARLGADELPHIRVEVSLLSKPEALHFRNEAEALAQLRPGVDGVILEAPGHRTTFLPQVWEQLPTPREFLRHLKQKAGLAPDAWFPGLRLSRYTVEKFKEAQKTPDEETTP